MKKKFFPITDVLLLLVGEIILSGLVILGYFLVDIIFSTSYLTYRVFTGALLGSAVTVLNYLFLVVSVNRAVNKFLNLRGTGEMDDEAAANFAEENTMMFRNAINLSFIIRTVTMLVTLVVAFLLDWFSAIATIIPLLAYRPLLMLVGLVKRQCSPKLDSTSFVSAGSDAVEASFTDLDTTKEERADCEEKESDN